MTKKLPFKFYKRPQKSGNPIFYARYLKPDGTYTAGRSTGCTYEKEAILTAWEYIQSGTITSTHRTLLKDFSKGFFSWTGEWATNKKAGGLRLSTDQCRTNQSLTNNYLIKHFGNRLLTDIDTATVKRFRNDLYRSGLSGSTINKILGCLRALLEAGEEAHLLRNMPRIQKAALNQKEKGVLTTAEVSAVFTVEWKDVRARVANMIAVATGFRLSEVHGIKRKNVTDGYIEITGSWSSRERRYKEGTKNTQTSRKVPIPPSVQTAIDNLMSSSPWNNPESFICYNPDTPERPMEHIVITRGFFDAMGKTDPPIDWNERNISFHSHRYFFNSLLIESQIPLMTIQKLTGHLSDSMTLHYHHPQDLGAVSTITGKLFNNVVPFKRVSGG